MEGSTFGIGYVLLVAGGHRSIHPDFAGLQGKDARILRLSSLRASVWYMTCGGPRGAGPRGQGARQGRRRLTCLRPSQLNDLVQLVRDEKVDAPARLRACARQRASKSRFRGHGRGGGTGFEAAIPGLKGGRLCEECFFSTPRLALKAGKLFLPKRVSGGGKNSDWSPNASTLVGKD